VNWSYLLTRFDGRISRQSFWLALLPVVAAEVVAHVVAGRVEGERLGAIVDLAFLYPEFAILAKRAQDRAMPMWIVGLFFVIATLMDFLVVLGLSGTREDPNALLMVVSVVWLAFALALIIELGFRRGTRGPNQYGPDPLETRV